MGSVAGSDPRSAIRDPLAARAFIAEYGDKGRALIRLGFPAINRLPPDRIHLYHIYASGTTYEGGAKNTGTVFSLKP